MKKIDILFLILLCIGSLNAISFVLADLYINNKELCIKYNFCNTTTIMPLGYFMIITFLIFSIFLIKKGDFYYRRINFLYLWFGVTQCVFLALLLILY